MPEFRREDGRRLKAPAGSALFRTLDRSSEWSEVSEVSGPPTPSAPSDPTQGLKRAELNELAADLGIENPESLPNADAVRAAINAAKE